MEEIEGGGMGAAGENLLFLHLKSAILAMEPSDSIIHLASLSGGGSLTTEVQSFILEHCIKFSKQLEEHKDPSYVKGILKKIIVHAESNHAEVIEGIYEKFAYCISSIKDTDSAKTNKRVIRQISFLLDSSKSSFIAPVRCSLNMLEGDTGCAIWPSSLFLSEFILSYPDLFTNKICFELGSGVGLVGIALRKVNALKVILTDGDISSLANLKYNMKLNHLDDKHQVECKFLPWETANYVELGTTQPEVILGADIIYNPACVPHLLRVFDMLLRRKISLDGNGHGKDCICRDNPDIGGRKISNPCCTESVCDGKSWRTSVAYIATVIRNADTFSNFLKLAGEANLLVTEITESVKISNLLPYMLSYDRASIHLYKVTVPLS